MLLLSAVFSATLQQYHFNTGAVVSVFSVVLDPLVKTLKIEYNALVYCSILLGNSNILICLGSINTK